MNELKVNIPGFDAGTFTFISPQELIQLLPNKPFPQELFDKNGGEIPLVAFNVKADKEFSIPGAEKVKFGIDGGGFAAFGVYQSSQKLNAALTKEKLNEELKDLLNLKIQENENTFALRWGYNFGASVAGDVGLFSAANPVKLTFGVNASTTGKSYLLHSFPRTMNVEKALLETFGTWKMPYQVENHNSLKEKTTVVFETMGNLDLALGVEYGYDFNWAREAVQFGGLSGDIGMKIEAGIKAQFGFSAVGNYALAVSRESADPKLRVQVFKLKEHGWTFSLDGGVSGEYTGTIIPEKFEDLVKGIFNLNGLQVLKDLETWMDESNSIKDLLGDKLEEYTKEFVRKVTGFDIDKGKQEIDKAIAAFKNLIQKWNELPHTINSYLYGLLGKVIKDASLAGEVAILKDVLGKVKESADEPQKLAAFIQEQLNKNIEFFSTPFGKWLSAYSKEGILSLLANLTTKEQSRKLADLAGKTLGFIDGSELAKQFEKLQREIEEKLNLDIIKNLDVDKWEKWLVRRLVKFLGIEKISDDIDKVIVELEKVRKVINETRKQAQKFYEVGYAALKKKYSFDFHYAFQKATGSSALVDVTLNFGGANLLPATALLQQALRGNFKDVLTNTDSNLLKINQAVFTHEIKRNTHLGVNVPYFSIVMDHITNSVASKKYVEAGDGRLWVYTLEAEDIVKKRKSLSRLAISLELSEKSGIRTFSTDNNKIDYAFYFGGRKIKRQNLERRFKFAADRYLSSAFPPGTTDFSAYMTTADNFLDKNGYPDTGDFGTVLMDLKVSLPGNVMTFWKDVPKTSNQEFYKDLSELIQSTLREWIPLNYIEGQKQYESTDNMFPLLAYLALPIKIDKELKNGVWYWEPGFDAKLKAELNKPDYRVRLGAKLEAAFSESGDSRYKPSNIQKVVDFVTGNLNGKGSFLNLCDMENDIIKGVVKTAEAFHKFDDQNQTDPKKQARFLAEFGAAFADTFNDEFGLNPIALSDYTPKGSLRPLGLMMFVKIIKLLKPDFDDTQFAAMFELLVLDKDVSEKDFKKYREEFLKGDFDEKDKKFALRQRIVNVAGLPM